MHKFQRIECGKNIRMCIKINAFSTCTCTIHSKNSGDAIIT